MTIIPLEKITPPERADVLHWHGIRPFTVPALTAPASSQVITSPCRLVGWSLASTDTAGLANSGTVTSPAAGATIASVAAVPAGEYTVSWLAELSGTVGAPEVNNFGLYVGAVLQTASANPGAAGNYPQDPVTVIVPAGGATVAIKAVVLGTVGAVYDANLSLTRAGGAEAVISDPYNTLGVSQMGTSQSDTQVLDVAGLSESVSITVQAISGTISGVVYARDQRLPGPVDLIGLLEAAGVLPG